MQSYEFEVKCKNALIDILKEKYNEDYTIQDLHLVWFTKALRNFKCTICDLKPNQRYYECTYNGDKDEVYIDIYDKQFNVVVDGKNLSSIVDTRTNKKETDAIRASERPMDDMYKPLSKAEMDLYKE